MNTSKHRFAFVLAISLSLFGCEKESQEIEQTPQGVGDTLNAEDNEFLEAASAPNPTLQEILDSDGKPLARRGNGSSTGTQDQAGTLTTDMLKYAQTLCDKKKLPMPGKGTDEPTHYGLVYSFGQRDLDHRLPPPKGDSLHRSYKVIGTDCSGLMINLLQKVGINIDGKNTSVSSFEVELNKALSQNASFAGLSAVNKGRIPANEIKSGDFILWRKYGRDHMGIIAPLTGDRLRIFQSNGTGTPSLCTVQPECSTLTATQRRERANSEQEKNLGTSRGVHPLDFAMLIGNSSIGATLNKYWGEHYEVLRIQVLSIKPELTLGFVKRQYNFEASIGQLPPNGSLLWDFGDKTPVVPTTGVKVSHSYAAVGTYTTSLRVVDASGKEFSKASAKTSITDCSQANIAEMAFLLGPGGQGKVWRWATFAVTSAGDCQGPTTGNPTIDFFPNGKVTFQNLGAVGKYNVKGCTYISAKNSGTGSYCLQSKHLLLKVDASNDYDGGDVEADIVNFTATKMTLIAPSKEGIPLTLYLVAD
ncbi:PKD domain-containing protein [Hymenobacter caeli]|uniref:PKD domain-containing protein n=1 Tax=Hymenobacter caeli TaxID=2735894 RepID=A0ABX2FUJ1_9BACT|nr:PKD domain-containing protein [Hymenobacter caeli]NRT20075.1 hypothetical protein [Hymenobacter caeli]